MGGRRKARLFVSDGGYSSKCHQRLTSSTQPMMVFWVSSIETPLAVLILVFSMFKSSAAVYLVSSEFHSRPPIGLHGAILRVDVDKDLEKEVRIDLVIARDFL